MILSNLFCDVMELAKLLILKSSGILSPPSFGQEVRMS